LAEANDCVVEMFEALVDHGVRKVLVDCRELTGDPTTLERFLHATFAVREMDRFSSLGLFHGTRFAYVGVEPVVDKHRFGQKVATNRGLNVKVTLSTHDALQWLDIDPDGDCS
ncbi:MAG: hypothetical protein P8181_17730, partial [bacterium]